MTRRRRTWLARPPHATGHFSTHPAGPNALTRARTSVANLPPLYCPITCSAMALSLPDHPLLPCSLLLQKPAWFALPLALIPPHVASHLRPFSGQNSAAMIFIELHGYSPTSSPPSSASELLRHSSPAELSHRRRHPFFRQSPSTRST